MRVLINLVMSILVTFVCTILYNICYSKIKNYEKNIKLKNLLITFCFSVLILLNHTFNSVEMKIVVNFFLFSIELKIIFKDSWKETIINYIILSLVLFVIELMVTNVLLYFNLLTNNNSVGSTSYINLVLTTITGILEYMLFSINKLKYIFQKLSHFFNNNSTMSNFTYLLLFTIIVIGLFNVKNFANSHSILLIFILTIIFAILFLMVIRLKYHEEILKVSNKKLIDYNNNYGKFLDDYKIYKHNIKNKLSAMKTFGNKKVNALIDDLLEEETTFTIKNNELYNIPNGIKGIVAEKLYNKDYHVIINNKIKKDPFSKLNARSFNSISEAIGIALDNAIEAAEETKEPIITMDLHEDDENIYLKIGNNYCNWIDLDNIGNKYYSTKNRGSGLGLFSIKQNKLVIEKIEIVNNFYYITLGIKKAR